MALYSDIYTENSAQCKELLIFPGKFAGVAEMTAPQRLNAENLNRKHNNLFDFCCWFVGITDSEGCFTIEKSGPQKFNWSFSIGQHYYNRGILKYIQNILGVGKIQDYPLTKHSKYRIRDRATLHGIIIPIFLQLPLLTSKEYKFKLWLRGLQIWESDLPKAIKMEQILEIRMQMSQIPNDYKAEAFVNLPSIKDDKAGSSNMRFELNNFFNPHWVSGFISGDGSFYLTNKSPERVVPGFCIAQKLDRHIMEYLRILFCVNTLVKHNNDLFMMDTTNLRSLNNVLDYFVDILIGKKHVEYIIWCKAVRIYSIKSPHLSGHQEKLQRLQRLLRKFRSVPTILRETSWELLKHLR